MIQPERVQPLSRRTVNNRTFVLYWMQAAQRAHWNHALEYAIEQANALAVPVGALFCLVDDYPEANTRHCAFMLEGLRETVATLAGRGISTLIVRGSPATQVPRVGRNASLVVTDRGYLRHHKQWRSEVARKLDCPLVQVETDAVVPVESASSKAEYSAATLRPKIGRLLLRYLLPLRQRDAETSPMQFEEDSLDLRDIDSVLASLPVDKSVAPVATIRGGTAVAQELLALFLETRLDFYESLGANPAAQYTSGLSPFLHFGQISPLYVALQVRDHGGPGADAYLEQLIVRRELSINFVNYNLQYDSLAALPDWARGTLAAHASDPRPYIYDVDELERASTHDPYWNAAQLEMVHTGSMHNHMRMYWGKKILEWSPEPADALSRMLYLNNRWQLDGRDPNSYAGIAWCLGMHDRAWQARPVFGKVRYMNAKGLERKFDIGEYVRLHGAES